MMHVREAELACIRHFRPCLNEQNNLQPSPIPAKYLEQEDRSQWYKSDLEDSAVDYIDL